MDTRDEVIDALVSIERGEIEVARFGYAPMADQQLFRRVCSLHRQILPSCQIRPVHDDSIALVAEVVAGNLDAAIVTLPVSHPDLQIDLLRRERLVVCLRKDDVLAQKPVLMTSDLRGNLNILYHPRRHPDAHELLVAQLVGAGMVVEEFSKVSHPRDMQMLVREG